jgi:hypothetical protein
MARRHKGNDDITPEHKNRGSTNVKYAIVALLMAFSVTEANAVVYCAAGAYYGGCVRRPPVRGVVVAPVHRRAVVGGYRRPLRRY